LEGIDNNDKVDNPSNPSNTNSEEYIISFKLMMSFINEFVKLKQEQIILTYKKVIENHPMKDKYLKL